MILLRAEALGGWCCEPQPVRPKRVPDKIPSMEVIEPCLLAAYCPLCEREVLAYYMTMSPTLLVGCVLCDLMLEDSRQVALAEAERWGYGVMEERSSGCGCGGGGCGTGVAEASGGCGTGCGSGCSTTVVSG